MEQTQSGLAEKLALFFQQWPKGLNISDDRSNPVLFPEPDALQHFFTALNKPLLAIRHDSFRFDPWHAAGIGHNEVRNSTLLAWLLDPAGSHGFGPGPLNALLKILHKRSEGKFPAEFKRYCRVQVETNPTGDSRNRVDIEMDSDTFFLLIEVKIRAGEQENQMQRYCDEAVARAGIRPWAVVFLTTHGGASQTAGPNILPEHIPAISWRQLALAFDNAVADTYQEITSSKPISNARLMAACSAISFIDHMRKL
jgi:hypothetical protein